MFDGHRLILNSIMLKADDFHISQKGGISFQSSAIKMQVDLSVSRSHWIPRYNHFFRSKRISALTVHIANGGYGFACVLFCLFVCWLATFLTRTIYFDNIVRIISELCKFQRI